MVQKTVLDYYEQVSKEYPTIPMQDIKRILLYGWKSFYLHNSYGADVLLTNHGMWLYCGRLMNNSIKYFDYYARKMKVKLRILYKRKKIQWDGFYYFALTKNQYEDYLALKNTKGRPRTNFNFGNVILYKIKDECSIMEHGKVAIFRVPRTIEGKFTIYKPDFKTNKSELVEVREPLKFEDILLSNYDYQYISDNLRKYNKNG